MNILKPAPCVLIATFCFTTPGHAAPPAALHQPEKVVFNRDIRPILSDNCFACHGPNKTARQANLRFDERESALQVQAIVPGHPEKSSLVARINANVFALMPPPTSHKSLTPAQKALLTRWISQGAKYEV